MNAEAGEVILILANEQDFAADTVIHQLQRSGRREVRRWNGETIEQHFSDWSPGDQMLPPGVRSVWLRQFLPDPSPMTTVREVDDFLAVREQWRTRLSALAEDPARWINPLWASRRAENKMVQLSQARKNGLQVPSTIVTSSKTTAHGRQEAVGDCVVKSVASAYFPFSDQAFMFTTPLNEALDLAEADWAAQPLIVQQRVSNRVDVRLFVIGDFVVAAATEADGPDWRLVGRNNDWRRCEVPESIADSARSLVAALGLVYGALDFAVSGDDWWFLECNQAGEFAFVDKPLNLGIASELASALER